MKKFKTTIDTINETFDFSDSLVPNAGTTALNQFNAKQTIHSFAMQNNVQTEIYIPFHAIRFMRSNATVVENEPAQDANC